MKDLGCGGTLHDANGLVRNADEVVQEIAFGAADDLNESRGWVLGDDGADSPCGDSGDLTSELYCVQYARAIHSSLKRTALHSALPSFGRNPQRHQLRPVIDHLPGRDHKQPTVLLVP